MKGAVAEKSKGKVWTYEDYLNSTDEGRYELINGRLEKIPAPSFLHQEVSRNLSFLLWSFVKSKGLGRILPAPLDVILGERVVVQPDIVFISEENLKNVREDRLFGPPDLVVEVVSPNTVRRDTFVKKELYAEAEVKEYWIVHPEKRAIEVWVLKGLELEIKEVFVDETSK